MKVFFLAIISLFLILTYSSANAQLTEYQVQDFEGYVVDQFALDAIFVDYSSDLGNELQDYYRMFSLIQKAIKDDEFWWEDAKYVASQIYILDKKFSAKVKNIGYLERSEWEKILYTYDILYYIYQKLISFRVYTFAGPDLFDAFYDELAKDDLSKSRESLLSRVMSLDLISIESERKYLEEVLERRFTKDRDYFSKVDLIEKGSKLQEVIFTYISHYVLGRRYADLNTGYKHERLSWLSKLLLYDKHQTRKTSECLELCQESESCMKESLPKGWGGESKLQKIKHQGELYLRPGIYCLDENVLLDVEGRFHMSPFAQIKGGVVRRKVENTDQMKLSGIYFDIDANYIGDITVDLSTDQYGQIPYLNKINKSRGVDGGNLSISNSKGRMSWPFEVGSVVYKSIGGPGLLDDRTERICSGKGGNLSVSNYDDYGSDFDVNKEQEFIILNVNPGREYLTGKDLLKKCQRKGNKIGQIYLDGI